MFHIEELSIKDKSEKGVEMPLLHPVNGKETGISFIVHNINSTHFEKASIELEAMIEKAKDNKDSKDEMIKLGKYNIFCYLSGWKGEPALDGKILDFNFDNFCLFLEHVPYASRQITEFITNIGNFLGNLKGDS